MLRDFKKFIGWLPPKAKTQLVLLTLSNIVLSMLDVLGIAVVFPIVQVVSGGDFKSGYLAWLHNSFGQPERVSFVVMLCILMCGLFLLKAVISIAISWWSMGFVMRLGVTSASRLLHSRLTDSYAEHRMRNAALTVRDVGSSVTAAHSKVLGGVVSLLTEGFTLIALLSVILIVAPIPTLVASLLFFITVFIIQKVLAQPNRAAGKKAQLESYISARALFDSVYGFREFKLHQVEDLYVAKFTKHQLLQGQASRQANFFSTLPKYMLELTTIFGIATAISIIALTSDSSDTLVTFAIMVAAIVKMLPSTVRITSIIGSIRVGAEGLAITVRNLEKINNPSDAVKRSLLPDEKTLPDNDGPIAINNVSFRYPDGTENVLTDINITIEPGSSLGICGASGSGKTTLVDIILGLYEPVEGSVTYQGIPIGAVRKQWLNRVAYIPQDVYITDDSLAKNIALGVPEEDIDIDRLNDAIERAQLLDLVKSLPNGYETVLGERGSRISGGQRQRIGIARALYQQPLVIVLDEATSALDNETEDHIARQLRSLTGNITTIIIAHRLSTVKHVDELCFLENGNVCARGTFQEVTKQSKHFARLVELGSLSPESTTFDDLAT